MPLIATATAVYAAGLLLGFGGVVVPGAALGLVGALVAAVRRDARLAGLAGVFASALLVAHASNATELQCRARALQAREWRAVLDDAAAPGAFVQLRLRVDGCEVPGAVAVERGAARAGARVVVRGVATASQRGLTVEHALLLSDESRETLRAVRAALGTRIDSIFRADAPLVRALLIADTRSLDPALRDRFAAAGIVHMLSISGLHVAIIAMAVQLLFQSIRLPRGAASVATIMVTALYVAVIGAPAPAVRSGVMLAVGAVSRLVQRPTSPWAALALGAAAPLVVPRTVVDVGYQLSVLGMASLIASGALARRWVAPRLSGWRSSLATIALTSVVASLASGPIVAWNFGRLSVVSPLTNVAATPLVTLAQPALFLGVLCAPVPAVARLVADATHPLLAALDGIATTAASLPYAALDVAPTMHGAVLAGAATVALLTACVSHFPARALIAGTASLTLGVWLPLAPSRPHGMELHVIDVGQGDAIALRTPLGRWLLFDAGRSWNGGDAGRSTVIPYLRRRGGEVAAFVLSHPHSDHVGGATSVLKALRPAEYWDGAYAGTSDAYRESLLAARDGEIRWQRTRPGDTLELDGVRVRVLAPDSAWLVGLDDPNEASVVAIAQFGAVRFLLVGDAERGEEEWLLAHARDALRADVLKVGHHGSSTSSTAPFLSAVRPRLALVSVGAGNSYGHPSPGVLHALARSGAAVLRTDRSGSIVVRTDGSSIEVEEGGDTWELSPERSRR